LFFILILYIHHTDFHIDQSYPTFKTELTPMRSHRLISILFTVLVLFLFVSIPTIHAEVPRFKDITGFDFGERITEHHQMIRYLEALAEQSPRVTIIHQGESWQGKSLLAAIVSSPENHARLEEIRHNAHRLGDPRTTTRNEATRIIENQPAVVWIGGSIHGFELSGTEGVLKLLEHLTTRDDETTLGILRNTVVIIDPMLNPDGRDAHAHYNLQRLGRIVTAEREDWTNDNIGWEALSYRTGHYFFDSNRDWFAHTQRETRARVQTIRAWRPQAGVDAHEMGPDVEFYFDPPTDPVSPFFPEYATRWFEVFGKAHAEAFDEAGFEYTLREMFNYFYPAYTTSYLSYQGAVGMLYEQGSSRGLALKRSDGSVRTLADALEQQYVASLAMVRTAADNRSALLQDYYDAHRTAVDDGGRGIRRYFITADGDPFHITELVNLLIRNGIEVSRTTDAVQLGNVRDRNGSTIGRFTIPAGSYVIDAAQPRNRLIRALLEPDVPIPQAFLEEARERVERAENPRFYDITTYSLPLLFNVNAYSTSDGRSLPVESIVGEIKLTGSFPEQSPGYAYIIDGRQSLSLAALYYIGDKGYRAGVITEPTRIEGYTYPRGTVVVRARLQDDGVHAAVREAAERFGLEVRGIRTGMPEPGYTAPGSSTTIDFRKPNIALVAEQPVFGYSFGWAWYTLDRQYEIPITVLRARSVGSMPLDKFDVIILPAVSGEMFSREIGEGGVERIKRWVQEGGTLITIGGGATDFAREQLELIKLQSWYDTDEGKNQQRFSIPGAMLRTELDLDTWLTMGYGEELPVLVNSDRVYLPSDDPPSTRRRIPSKYTSTDRLRISGHIWEESSQRLPGTIFTYEERSGRGRVIAFSEDVNFRAYWRGANRMFLNAVLLGPSAP
jgi:hypothetical protein